MSLHIKRHHSLSQITIRRTEKAFISSSSKWRQVNERCKANIQGSIAQTFRCGKRAILLRLQSILSYTPKILNNITDFTLNWHLASFPNAVMMISVLTVARLKSLSNDIQRKVARSRYCVLWGTPSSRIYPDLLKGLWLKQTAIKASVCRAS